MKTTLKLFLAAALVLVAVAACMPGINPGSETTTGIKVVGIFHGQKSILPPISMDPNEWRVQGTGPGTFDTVLPLGGGIIPSLTPGAWHLVVTARNAAHDALGEGTADCTVVFGQTAVVNVAVIEYSSPNGAVDGTIQWEPDIVVDPHFNVVLTDTAGVTEKQMPYSLDLLNCTGSGNVADVHPGWWTAVGTLLDGARASTGFAAAVRVAAGRTTSMAVALHATQTSGQTSLTFSWSGNNELQITSTPGPGDIQLYDNQPQPMSVSSLEPGITAKWYINGSERYQGTAVVLDPADFNHGNDYYRLDVVAISQDQQRASSLTWNIQKNGAAPNTTRISGVANAQNWSGNYFIRVTLRSAALPTVVIGTQTAPTSSGAYAFNAVAEGDYVLKAEIVGYEGVSWAWWTAAGGSMSGPDTIHVLTAPGAVFNFGQVF